MLSVRIQGLFGHDKNCNRNWRKKKGKIPHQLKTISTLVFSRFRTHVPQCRSWVTLRWYLNGNGHTNFQRALLKVTCTARLWAALTVRSEKQGQGWEAADGKAALNRPGGWHHLVPSPHGLLCQSRTGRLWYTVFLFPTPLIGECTWAVVSGGK